MKCGIGFLLLARGGAAQSLQPTALPVRPDPTTPANFPVRTTVGELRTLGSPADERDRVDQLLGRSPAAGYLLRSATSITPAWPVAERVVSFVALLPEVRITHNSALPTADNDGALWAGRGASALVRGGFAVRAGRVTVVFAPEVSTAQNLGFQTTPTGPSGQFPATGPFNAPWFVGAYSADLPLRFGDQRYTIVTPGQSGVHVTAGRVIIGATTENEWWGPGARNALLVSNAAEGVPRLFVRTTRPLHTRAGDVEARWFAGAPTPSTLYDARGGPEGRTLSAAAATLRLKGEPGLTLGVARLVLASQKAAGLDAVLGHAFDVFTRNDNLGTGDTLTYPRRTDQLTSLFARWLFPEAGTEIYAEFAREELPRSFRDLLLAPQNTGAYTLGVGRAWALARRSAVRMQLEVTNLEQSRVFTDRPPTPDYYTGRAAPAGFTSRGQVLGAAIGPGSSGQWASVDYYTPTAQIGLFARRTRNQNDALYRQFLANLSRHDVTVGWGLRGGARVRGLDARAELAVSNRLNYLFQNGAAYTYQIGTVDVRNVSLSLDLSPHALRGRR